MYSGRGYRAKWVGLEVGGLEQFQLIEHLRLVRCKALKELLIHLKASGLYMFTSFFEGEKSEASDEKLVRQKMHTQTTELI